MHLGSEIAFEEVEDGKLLSYRGLETLVTLSDDVSIYIFDNHNHALYARRQVYQQL